MNLSFKTLLLCGAITEERLNDSGVMISALKHIRNQFEHAWRHGGGGGTQGRIQEFLRCRLNIQTGETISK